MEKSQNATNLLDITPILELKSAVENFTDTPQSRVLDLIYSQKDPILESKIPIILALCETYFYRKITTGDIHHLIELIKKHSEVAHANVALTSDFEGTPV